MASGGGAGVRRRRRRTGLRGLCWKTCCFPLLVWVVSVCGEERTLIVEVGGVWPVCVMLERRAAPCALRPTVRGNLSVCVRACLCVCQSLESHHISCGSRAASAPLFCLRDALTARAL